MTRRGRPYRAGERASCRVEITFTPSEFCAVRALARANDCSVADLLRMGVLSLAEESGATYPPIVLGGTLQSFAIIRRE